jgi:hypothetical protein
MKELYAPKENYVSQCMDLLEGSYTSESEVFKKVERGLHKLSKDELSGLYSMLLCEVKLKTKAESDDSIIRCPKCQRSDVSQTQMISDPANFYCNRCKKSFRI